MKKILLLFCFLFIFYFTSIAQKQVLKILEDNAIVGKNILTQKDIIAKTFTYPLNIYRISIDTRSKYITTFIRETNYNKTKFKKKGYIFQFDLGHNNLMWIKNVNYSLVHLNIVEQNILEYTKDLVWLLDFEKGFIKKKLLTNIGYINNSKNIGIGYKIGMPSSNVLDGIDLNNGKKLWEREIPRKYGWSDVLSTKDSSFLIVASGLHKIDFQTGKGWDYGCTTTDKNYNSMIAKGALGILSGILTGVAIIPTAPDIITNINSNIATDSLFYYFASKEFISKINKKSGKEIKRFPFPKKKASTSKLLLLDSTLIDINTGVANMNGHNISYGKPFLAIYDKNTLKQKSIFFFDAKRKKNNFIIDFKINHDSIYILQTNKISVFNLPSGKLLLENKLKSAPKFTAFTKENIYIQKDSSSYTPLLIENQQKTFISTQSGDILQLDKKLNFIKKIPRKKQFIKNIDNEKFKLFSNQGKIFIYDAVSNSNIAQIDAKSVSYILNKLYYTKERTLYEIDLNDILKKL